MGATRVRVGSAVAFPSRRNVELVPLLYFAAQGFPREASWCRRWRAEQGGPHALKDFDRPNAGRIFAKACFVRQVHSLVLFRLMPAYVAGLFERSDRRDVLDSPLDELASKIPVISSKDIAANPGRLFEALFAMIERSEEHTSELQSLMRISYAVFCLKKKKKIITQTNSKTHINTINKN